VELEQAVRARRSIRLFYPDKPVPRELVVEALELAIGPRRIRIHSRGTWYWLPAARGTDWSRT
jgi:hypothetical protein